MDIFYIFIFYYYLIFHIIYYILYQSIIRIQTRFLNDKYYIYTALFIRGFFVLLPMYMQRGAPCSGHFEDEEEQERGGQKKH